MVNRVAKYLKVAISPLSSFITDIGAVAMVLVMLLVVADVCMRRFFNSPIRGSGDLVILGFSMIAFFPMASAALKGEHVILNILTEKMPRVPRSVLELIMMLATTGILGIASWRLCLQGMRLQDMNSQTALLGVPYPPFLYLATFAFALMALVFFVKAIESLSKLLGEH